MYIAGTLAHQLQTFAKAFDHTHRRHLDRLVGIELLAGHKLAGVVQNSAIALADFRTFTLFENLIHEAGGCSDHIFIRRFEIFDKFLSSSKIGINYSLLTRLLFRLNALLTLTIGRKNGIHHCAHLIEQFLKFLIADWFSHIVLFKSLDKQVYVGRLVHFVHTLELFQECQTHGKTVTVTGHYRISKNGILKSFHKGLAIGLGLFVVIFIRHVAAKTRALACAEDIAQRVGIADRLFRMRAYHTDHCYNRTYYYLFHCLIWFSGLRISVNFSMPAVAVIGKTVILSGTAAGFGSI